MYRARPRGFLPCFVFRDPARPAHRGSASSDDRCAKRTRSRVCARKKKKCHHTKPKPHNKSFAKRATTRQPITEARAHTEHVSRGRLSPSPLSPPLLPASAPPHRFHLAHLSDWCSRIHAVPHERKGPSVVCVQLGSSLSPQPPGAAGVLRLLYISPSDTAPWLSFRVSVCSLRHSPCAPRFVIASPTTHTRATKMSQE